MLNVLELIRRIADKHGLRQEQLRPMKLPGRKESDAPVCFMIFAGSRPHAVLKTQRFPEPKDKLRIEAEQLQRVAALPAEISSKVPIVIDSGVIADRNFFFLSFVDGIQRSFRQFDLSDCLPLFEWLATLQMNTQIGAPSWRGLDTSNQWLGSVDSELMPAAEDYLAKLQDTCPPPHECLIHGDFNLYNILWKTDDFWVIDWEYSRNGWSYFDPCFFLSQLVIDNSGLRDLARGLLSLYRKLESDSHLSPLAAHLVYVPLFIRDALAYDFGSHKFPLRSLQALRASLDFVQVIL